MSEKKRLLISTDCFLPRKDGISRFLTTIMLELEKHFQVTILAPDYQGQWDKRIFANATIERFPLTNMAVGDFILSRPDKAVIRKHVQEADLVWNHTLGPVGICTIRLAKRYHKKIVSQVHSQETELISNSISPNKIVQGIMSFLSRRVLKSMYKKCDLLLVASKSTQTYLQKQGVHTPITIAHMGVDPEMFVPTKRKITSKSSLRIHPNTFVIGYTGRIGKEKDLFTLAKAFKLFQKKHKDSLLLIVGDGPEKLKKRLASGHTKITGFVQNVVPFLQAMDVFVLPSLTETSSLSTMEAMACELPVIVTPVGHLRSYVENGFNGFIFPRGDVESLKDHLEKLHKDKKLAKAMGQRGRKTILVRYTKEKMKKKILTVLKDLAQQ